MAIDYKQLRAGNLVLNHKGGVHVITPWDIWNLECYFTKNMVADKRLEDWRYIPLDKEWFVANGFSFSEDLRPCIFGFIGPFNFNWWPDNNTITFGGEDEVIKHITCVHNFQNFYNSLAGVELEVKL